jgi:hypothetical protein
MHPGPWHAGTQSSGKCVTPKQQLMCCSCEGNHNADHRSCSKWQEIRAAASKQTQCKRGRSMASPVACMHPTRLYLRYHQNRRDWALTGTTLSNEAAWLRRMQFLFQHHSIWHGQAEREVGYRPGTSMECRWTWSAGGGIPTIALRGDPKSSTTPNKSSFDGIDQGLATRGPRSVWATS